MVSPILAVLVAVSFFRLQSTGTLEKLSTGFFESLGISEQIALTTIVFAALCWAVSVAQFVGPGGGEDHDDHDDHDDEHAPPLYYPIPEIQEALNDTNKTEKDRFMVLYPMVRNEILEHVMTTMTNDDNENDDNNNDEMTDKVVEWSRELMDNTVMMGGKLTRGLAVVQVHQALIKGGEGGGDDGHHHRQELKALEYARAAVLGWAVEFLHAFFLSVVDIDDYYFTNNKNDSSKWTTNTNTNATTTTTNTTATARGGQQKLISKLPLFLLLESFVFSILKLHFEKEPYYSELRELFLDVIQKTEFGQLLDCLTSSSSLSPLSSLQQQQVDENDVSLSPCRRFSFFTMERYRKIVKYKTSFHTFYLPIAIGMISTAKITTSTQGYQKKKDSLLLLIREISCMMGEFFQIQEDFFICYGNPQKTTMKAGKVGTDIQENKCSWLIVQALERATPAQRKVLETNYGVVSDDDNDNANNKKVTKVKALYNELNLKDVFEKYKEESYQAIQKKLNDDKMLVTTTTTTTPTTTPLVPRDVFDVLLKSLYNRSK